MYFILAQNVRDILRTFIAQRDMSRFFLLNFVCQNKFIANITKEFTIVELLFVYTYDIAFAIDIARKLTFIFQFQLEFSDRQKGPEHFFLLSDIYFCISYRSNNNSLSHFQWFRYAVHYISLNKICIIALSVIWRMTCWPQRCTDVESRIILVRLYLEHERFVHQFSFHALVM